MFCNITNSVTDDRKVEMNFVGDQRFMIECSLSKCILILTKKKERILYMRRKNLNISYKENQRGRRHIYSVKAVNTNNGNYVEFELEIPKIYLMENVMVRSVALREIENSSRMKQILSKRSIVADEDLNDLMISSFKAGNKYEKRGE